MNVAILGAGPAGIMAAAKAIEMGHPVSIFAHKLPSQLLGAQYLHCPPPIVSPTSFKIHYKLVGSAEGYRQKVYGENWAGDISPNVIEEDHMGYDIREAYFRLREMFPIHEAHFSDFIDVEEAGILDNFDYIFSSVPRPTWKVANEEFKHQDVWAIGQPDDEEPIVAGIPDNTVLCNGDENPSWYRASNIDGYRTVEWPFNGDTWRTRPMIPGVSKIKKPLQYIPSPTTPNPANDAFIHIGRYGEWKKGILASHAIQKVEDTLK